MKTRFREQEHRAIENHYLDRWDFVEDIWRDWFRRGPEPLTAEIMSLIWALRERGYDRQLEACQAQDVMDGWSIITLTRSAYYRHRDDQPRLDIVLMDENWIDIRFTALNVNYIIAVEHLELNPEIEHLLSLLLAHPID